MAFLNVTVAEFDELYHAAFEDPKMGVANYLRKLGVLPGKYTVIVKWHSLKIEPDERVEGDVQVGDLIKVETTELTADEIAVMEEFHKENADERDPIRFFRNLDEAWNPILEAHGLVEHRITVDGVSKVLSKWTYDRKTFKAKRFY